MKNIIINKDKSKMMSFDDIYIKYTPLIKKKIYKWMYTYEYDELFQIASIALWKAYKDYDADKAPTAFGYVAGIYIDNELTNYHHKSKPKYDQKTSQVKSVVSINGSIFTGKNGDELNLEDILGEDETFTQIIADKMVIEKVLKKFTSQQIKDIENYINGYGISEIARNNNVSKQVVSWRMKNNFIKFKSLYIKEMSFV